MTATAGGGSFVTSLGACGLEWSSRGVTRVRLPGDPGLAGLPPLHADAPRWVSEAAAAIGRLLAGGRTDLAGIPVDLSGLPDFTRRVLETAREIPAGTTVTYGALASRTGRPGSARAVGQAMARNPVPLLVPCHRVLSSTGALTGFSAPGGTATKKRLLEIERRAT
jgi:methylated-DNA-[protein]-cysteine S-methyltransferase